MSAVTEAAILGGSIGAVLGLVVGWLMFHFFDRDLRLRPRAARRGQWGRWWRGEETP